MTQAYSSFVVHVFPHAQTCALPADRDFEFLQDTVLQEFKVIARITSCRSFDRMYERDGHTHTHLHFVNFCICKQDA